MSAFKYLSASWISVRELHLHFGSCLKQQTLPVVCVKSMMLWKRWSWEELKAVLWCACVSVSVSVRPCVQHFMMSLMSIVIVDGVFSAGNISRSVWCVFQWWRVLVCASLQDRSHQFTLWLNPSEVIWAPRCLALKKKKKKTPPPHLCVEP